MSLLSNTIFTAEGNPSSVPGAGVAQATSPKSPQPPHSRAMQRMLSQESTGSASTATASGPPVVAAISGQPSSPAGGSGGVSTPKARQVSLSVEGGGRKDEQLSRDLEELQVRSPHVMGDTSVPGPPGQADDAMEDIVQPTPTYAKGNGLGNGQGNGHERGLSGSTDSSDSGSQLPSQLGSMYGAEGFTTAPSHTSPYGYNIPQSDSPEYTMTAAAAAAVAAADEAVKQLNGTTTVYHGIIPSIPGPQQISDEGLENPYQLPRGYANFVKPQNKNDGAGISRQSSTSSSTTEASTSSEEEDLCIPRIEWVDKDAGGQAPQTWANGFFTPFRAGSGAASIVGVGAGTNAQKGNGSPARMPPPASTSRITSPRTKNPASPLPTSIPSGSTHTPSGLGQSSALPSGVPPEAMDEDDDDQTIGQRDKSPSTSSHSSQSGLDLLIRAVTHSSSGKDRAEDVPRPTDATNDEATSPSYDGKGKRKAGSKAVDQWRNSGIPTGVGSKGKPGKTARFREREDTTSTEPETPLAGPPPKKKRRRSSAMDEREVIDPELLAEDGMRNSAPAPVSIQYGEEEQYAQPEEEMVEDESEPDDGASEGDSEYAGEGKKKVGRRAAPAARRTTVRGRSSLTSSAAHNAVAGSSKSGTPTASGGAKKGRKNSSPSGTGKGKAAAAAAAAAASTSAMMVPGGVQCDYVNPLPPFNRCQDVFTRKYDLPRHMARHGRREGELVYEGKLAEEKALLWAAIKDRPKVTCDGCGESFTRMDALKRHQAKQHH